MFSQHQKSIFWSEKNTLKPFEVALNSHKKFWFNCECGHEFDSSLLNINHANNWCPYCSKPPQKLCNNDNCKSCFEKSFASHEKSAYWLDENELIPRQVFKGADKKNFKFKCDKCNHNFEMVVKNITSRNNWCSYCAHQKLCENKECRMCFNNSFASVKKSKYLNDKNINPRTIFKSTNKKYKFDCVICNKQFETQLSDVTNGVWCSFCINKTEQILFDKLKEKCNTLESQYRINWCKNIKSNRCLPFDFVIKEGKIIIELDGKQHFEQVGKWLSPEETRKNDLYKMKCANENEFSVIRILQKDVYHNKYDWLQELCENIEKITKEKKVQNIYMCKNNEYKDFDIQKTFSQI
jgi:very-short-patch-repair endonuclease